MPLFGGARILLRPRFSRVLNIVRRSQTVDEHGRTVNVEEMLHPRGVITQGSIEEIVQDPNAQYARRTIVVHSYQFRLRDNTTGGSPDIAVYKGDRYLVRRVYDWSDYGDGFTAADCDLMTPETTADGV